MFNKIIWIWIFISIFLGLIIVGFYINNFNNTDTINTDIPVSALKNNTIYNTEKEEIIKDALEDRIFQSSVANIKGQIPKSWYKIDVENTRDPIIGGKLLFSFINSSESCKMSYVTDVRKYIPKPWQQISHGKRIFSKEWQIDSNWIAPLSAGITEYQNRRTPLGGELRLALLHRKQGAIILYNTNNGTVSDICSKDMDTLLESLSTHIEDVRLTNKSDGIIKVMEIGGDRDHSRKNVLTFSPSVDSDSNYRVFGVDNLSNGNIFIISDDMISIGLTDDKFNNNINIVNPVAGTSYILIKSNQVGYIIDMYVVDNIIYFLTVPTDKRYCLDKGPCISDLYKILYDNDSKEQLQPVMIAEDIKVNRILGFSKDDLKKNIDNHVVYISGGYGDAGCISEYFTKYIQANGSGAIIDMGRYGGCIDSIGYREYRGTIDAINLMTQKSIQKSSGIRLENSKLTPWIDPAVEERWSYVNFIFNN